MPQQKMANRTIVDFCPEQFTVASYHKEAFSPRRLVRLRLRDRSSADLVSSRSLRSSPCAGQSCRLASPLPKPYPKEPATAREADNR
jgi:hypothetical protein